MTENPYSSRLRSLIDQYGIPTPETTPRFKSLLQDVFVDNPRELNLLIAGLEEGIPVQLRDKKGTIPFEVISGQMTDRLNNNRGLERGVSAWIVGTWAEAIGCSVLSSPTHTNQQKSPHKNMGMGSVQDLQQPIHPSINYDKRKEFPIQSQPISSTSSSKSPNSLIFIVILIIGIVGVVIFLSAAGGSHGGSVSSSSTFTPSVSSPSTVTSKVTNPVGQFQYMSQALFLNLEIII